MTQRSLLLIGLFGLVCVFAAIETAVGVPLSAMAIAILVARNLPPHLRTGWLVAVSVVIASLLGLALSWTALSMLVTWGVWFQSRRVIASQTLRVLLAVSVGAFILAFLTQLTWSISSTVMLVISAVFTTIVSIGVWRTPGLRR